MWISVAAFFIFLSTLVFVVNAFRSLRKGERAALNPERRDTKGMDTFLTPPVHNFDRPPEVTRSLFPGCLTTPH